MSTADTATLARSITTHIARLCACETGRDPGSAANDEATEYVSAAMRATGLEVEELEFHTTGWHHGEATLRVGELLVEAHPGPFSPPLRTTAPLVAVSSAEELHGLSGRGDLLLLHGPLAAEQLTPRNYPWYSNPGHARILDAIEQLEPCAIIAATGKNPGTTGALSPFPLIEDPSFDIPTAYVDEHVGLKLLAHAGSGSGSGSASGAAVDIAIDSERFDARALQLIGILRGDPGARRILVTSHVDTKPDTPGALDNASGVAVMLAVAEQLAEQLAGTELSHTIEFVPFNGEDHATSPGEVTYLNAYPATDDIALIINLDGAGLAGGPSGVSSYNLPDSTAALVNRMIAAADDVTAGEQWLSSDHAIFAMKGVPALAITSYDLETAMSEITHTAADTPGVIDASVLAGTARFIAELVRSAHV